MAEEKISQILQKAEFLPEGINEYVGNIALTGMNGIATQTKFIDASAPLTLEPVLPIVIHAPKMYDPFPALQQAIKEIIETRIVTISGVDLEYTVEVASRIAGNDGQNFETPTQTKRSPVAPVFTANEVSGNPIYKLFTQWQHDIQHPDSNISFSRFKEPPPFVPSSYGMSILLIQPDPTHRPERIVETTFITNMFPKTLGPLGMEKQTGVGTTKERPITFSGLIQNDEAIRELGRTILTELQLHKANMDMLPPTYNKIADAIRKSGIAAELDALPKREYTAEA
ncbi:MAG: hypothetical protein GY804_09460 [Alphaproteobacteria bacterium]|nr:hypothetical protein [Alphaproteobacteria bacterium]